MKKKVIVTGSSRGLGKAIAEEFVKSGYDVGLCSIDTEELVQTAAELKEKYSALDPKIEQITVNMADEGSIDGLFDYMLDRFGDLHVLVNNAGIQGPIGKIEQTDWNKWKDALSINLLGPVYSMRRAIDIFTSRNHGGKIINISGGGATGPRPYFSSYAAAKVSIVRLTESLAAEVSDRGIEINAIAPGAMNTAMTVDVINSGQALAGEKEYLEAVNRREKGGASKERAAELAVYLAEHDGITGRLISAVWDEWEKLADNKEEIMGSNLYTLRRIIPE